MTYAPTRKQDFLDPSQRLGRQSIRSLFRVIVGRWHASDSAWPAIVRPMIDVSRAAIEVLPAAGRPHAARRLIEDCVIGLVALANAGMPGINSRIPNLGIALAASPDDNSPFAAELRIVIGGDDARPHALHLAETVGSGLAVLGFPVAVAAVPGAQFDDHVGHGSRWTLVWGLPDAVRWA